MTSKRVYSAALILIFILSNGSLSVAASPFQRDTSTLPRQLLQSEAKITTDGLTAGDWSQIQALLNRHAAPTASSQPATYEIIPPVYFKASNPDSSDQFGYAMAVWGDTVVVGAKGESSNAMGVGGDQTDNSSAQSGAAYVFVHSGQNWVQQAYLKASNTDPGDYFGCSVAMSGDTIIIGACGEDGNGQLGESDNSAADSGAAYIFVRDETSWSQQAYLKASNAGSNDLFGYSVAISGDRVVVGAYQEDSSATGVNGDQANNLATDSGAAYVFSRSETVWSQQAYLKASNTDTYDWFGYQVAVDGVNIVVGAPWEDSNNVGHDQSNNSAFDAGAAYLFRFNGTLWSQLDYIKASNAEASDHFGMSVAIAHETIVIGAPGESSGATGVNGDQNDNSVVSSGAAYVFLIYCSGGCPQHAYLKASNPDAEDHFGWSVAVDYNASIVVSAPYEDSCAKGLNGDQSDNTAIDSGAAYTFYYQLGVGFVPGDYHKAPNTDAGDLFGWQVALAPELETYSTPIVIGARLEDSNSSGINGDQSNNWAPAAGAAYIPLIMPVRLYLPIVVK